MVHDDTTIARFLRSAAELRSIASQISNLEERDIILKAAEAYEAMANWKPTEPMKKLTQD